MGIFLLDATVPPPVEPWYRNYGMLGCLLTIIAMIPGYLLLLQPWLRQGRNGQRELRAIYRCAVSKAGGTRRLSAAARTVVDDPNFFEQFILPNAISRRSEHAEFQRRLQLALPSVVLSDIQQFLSAAFDEIFKGLQHAQYSAWQSKYQEWRDELNALPSPSTQSATQPSVKRREQRFLFLSLHRSEPGMRQAENGAIQFFRSQDFSVSRRGGDELIIATPECETSSADWKMLLARSLAAVRAANVEQKQIHLILHTVSVWNIAFGILLNNRIPLVLYHWQQQYFPLWTIDRSVKDLRSPKMHSSSRALLNVEYEGVSEGVESEPAEAIVVQLGANHAANDVRNWLVKHGRRMPLRIVSKKTGRLDPLKPEDWIQCAAEIAELIDLIDARDIYFFADMPAVLALMVGDALGPYRSNIHLMQFLNGSSEHDYQDVLVVSKELIAEIDGNAC